MIAVDTSVFLCYAYHVTLVDATLGIPCFNITCNDLPAVELLLTKESFQREFGIAPFITHP